MSLNSKPRVFISYARKDGEAFASKLRLRLETEEPEITLWQDRANLEGGVGWRKQITDALDEVEFLLLVLTPAAIISPIVRWEWQYARQRGVCVYPIMGASGSELAFRDMPLWMSNVHWIDIDHEWTTFVQYLKSPCQVNRIPFTAPDRPSAFVDRPKEFLEIKGHLLDPIRGDPVAITTALQGSGGFGKTTLAIALCHDDDIITAYGDGILWVTLGEKPNLVAALTKLYDALTGERPVFVDIENAAFNLRQKLENRNCLLVLDDVWDPIHLKPFLNKEKLHIKHHPPANTLAAFSNTFFSFLLYHHFGVVFFIKVSIPRIPIRLHIPFNFPANDGCMARRLMAKPLSRYSMWCQ